MKLILILFLLLSSYTFAGHRMAEIEVKECDKYPQQFQLFQDSFAVIEYIINSDEFKENELAEKQMREDIESVLE